MGWRVFYLFLPLLCFALEYDASSSPTDSNISNHLGETPKHCQISPLHKTNIKRRNYIDVKHQEATPLKSSRSSSSIRVKRDLMKLNLFDLPRALVWLLNRLNRGRRMLLKEMVPSHLPASYSRADLCGKSTFCISDICYNSEKNGRRRSDRDSRCSQQVSKSGCSFDLIDIIRKKQPERK